MPAPAPRSKGRRFQLGSAGATKPARADRHADCGLAFTRGGASEHHGGEVCAGDEEDESDRAKQDEEERFHAADHLLFERINRRPEAVGLRVVILERVRIPLTTVSSSAWACCGETPGASRPMTP